MGCGLLTESLPADADAGDSLLHHESLRWPTNTQNPATESRIVAQRDVADAAHAPRLAHLARPCTDRGRPGIIGLNGFIGAMNKMKRGAEQDDPYSDWWMLRIEDKLADTKTRLETLREQVDQALADVPPALSLGENMNVQPVKLPLFVNAQLGFMAVYLLADYDDLARNSSWRTTALIDRSTLERWLNEGAHALRSLFSLAQQYRYSGTTRRLRGEERGGASGAGEIRRAAAAGAGRHAPLALRATDRAADEQARHAACCTRPRARCPVTRMAPPMVGQVTRGRRMTASPPSATPRASWRWNRRTSSGWNTQAT